MVAYFWSTFKKYLKSKVTYFSLFFSIFLLLSLGWIFPSGIIVPAVITFSSFIIIMILFGGSVIELRRTSMIKSLALTKISKGKFLVINIFVASLFVIFSTIIILFLSWILVATNFLASDLGFFGYDYLVLKIDWSKVLWISLIYALIITGIVTFVLTFFIISFTKSSYALYLFVFVYSFLLLGFGDVITPRVVYSNSGYVFLNKLYWALPNFYTNKLVAGSLSTTNFIPESINQSLLLNDIHALQAWSSADFPTTFTRLIDWSNVDGYQDGYVFYVDRLNNPGVQVGLTTWVLVGGNQDSFDQYLAIAETIITFGNEYALWNFQSFSSMMVCFFPIVLALVLGIISVQKFKWVVK